MSTEDLFENIVVAAFSIGILSTTESTFVEKVIDGVRMIIMFQSIKYIWTFFDEE
jgi:hypothetical protein